MLKLCCLWGHIKLIYKFSSPSAPLKMDSHNVFKFVLKKDWMEIFFRTKKSSSVFQKFKTLNGCLTCWLLFDPVTFVIIRIKMSSCINSSVEINKILRIQTGLCTHISINNLKNKAVVICRTDDKIDILKIKNKIHYPSPNCLQIRIRILLLILTCKYMQVQCHFE